MVDEPSSSQPDDPGGHAYFQNFQHTPIGARVPEKIGRGAFATALMVLQTNEIFVLDMLSMASQPQQVVGRIVMTARSFSQFLNALRLNVQHYERELGPLKPRFTPPQMGPHAGPGSHAAPGSSGETESTPSGGNSVFAGEGFGDAGGSSGPIEGGLMPEPQGHSTSSPTGPITELYEQLKFSEDLLGGAFANAVMIRHTPEEFCFDFISSLYPRPVVVCRIFASAGRVPSFIDAMAGSLDRYQSGGSSPP
jgi:hypothetical protein